jgi:hypothetical protein
MAKQTPAISSQDYTIIRSFDDADRLVFYDALCEYAFRQNHIEIPSHLKDIVEVMKSAIQKSDRRILTSKLNGRKGGRPVVKNLTQSSQEKPNNLTERKSAEQEYFNTSEFNLTSDQQKPNNLTRPVSKIQESPETLQTQKPNNLTESVFVENGHGQTVPKVAELGYLVSDAERSNDNSEKKPNNLTRPVSKIQKSPETLQTQKPNNLTESVFVEKVEKHKSHIISIVTPAKNGILQYTTTGRLKKNGALARVRVISINYLGLIYKDYLLKEFSKVNNSENNIKKNNITFKKKFYIYLGEVNKGECRGEKKGEPAKTAFSVKTQNPTIGQEEINTHPEGGADPKPRKKSFRDWNELDLRTELNRFRDRYTDTLVEDFVAHWMEPLPSGKPRISKAEAFDVGKRIGTFVRNDRQGIYKKPDQPKPTAKQGFRTKQDAENYVLQIYFKGDPELNPKLQYGVEIVDHNNQPRPIDDIRADVRTKLRGQI